MKRYLSIIFGSFLLSLVACNGNLDELDRTPDGNGKIIVSAKSLGVTRSADTDPESTLAWVDVYVMDASKNIVYSERIDKSSSPVVGGGEFVLGKNREEFEKDKGYYFYLIANSTAPLSDAKTWDELKKLSQKDEHLHLSGITGIEDLTAPKYFLMDGFAYVPTAGSTTVPAEMPLMVLNNGVNDDDLILGGTLVRAAAKLMITIYQGDSVEFKEVLADEDGNAATPLYSYYQLPISTLMVRPDATTFFNSEKQNTKEWGIDNRNQSFNWNTENGEPVITLVGYAYANDWSKNPANESALLLSIPMMWNKDGDENNTKEAASPVNWYKVPLSKNDKFERNKCYVLNITINAVGAEEQNTPIELKDIEYVTLDWQEVKVQLGDTQAKYLTLNTDLVKIYDTNFDLDQLTFSSSSPIKSIKLKDTFNESNGTFSALKVTKESDGTTETEYEEGDGVSAYYVDKFGQKIQLGTDPNFDIMISNDGYTELTKEQILELENNLLQKYIRAEVPADQQRALNGNIHIYSPINAEESGAKSIDGLDVDDLNWNSHFNAVRYLEFEVMNEQGLTATFRVEQTPTTVITNIEGFFSYRSDFCACAPLYHNPDDWISPVAYAKPQTTTHTYGMTNVPKLDGKPAHLLNPAVPVFSLSGFQAYHEDEVNSNGIFLYSTCQNGTKYDFEEILYGGMPRVYYRTYDEASKCTFHRGHYVSVPQPTYFYAASMWNSKGASNASNYYIAIGLPFTKEIDGKTRYYRRHYTGNLFETFQSKFVRQVYTDDDDDSRNQPILEEVWYCPTCTKNRAKNTEGKYVPTSECLNPSAHKGDFYNGYYDTGRKKKISKGMGEIYKLMGSGEGDDWDLFTALNPYILKDLTPSTDSKGNPTWTINRTFVPGAILHNHRMYHVRVTTTSDKYTVAVPKMMDEKGKQTNDRERGFTMESADNAKIVSPSFMIASQLGETLIPHDEAHYVMPGIKTIYDLAKNQCREYVETYYVDDDNSGGYTPGDRVYHYDDWRLPTKAEIEYIVQHQETSRAMDKVLDAQYYFHASLAYDMYTEKNILSEEIKNYDQAFTGWYMRCVRDAFKEPIPVTYSGDIPAVLKLE